MTTDRRGSGPEDLHPLLQTGEGDGEDLARARRERQIRMTAADIDEVKAICESALAAIGVKKSSSRGPVKTRVREVRLTRGGLIIRGAVYGYVRDLSIRAPLAMRRALEDLGFVLGNDFGRDGVIVTGWDPWHYEGDQLTLQRVRTRVRELRELERGLLKLESSESAAERTPKAES